MGLDFSAQSRIETNEPATPPAIAEEKSHLFIILASFIEL
jgi:hypothetical protein